MRKKSVVLFTHRFFFPDSAPYGLMLKSIADEVSRDDSYDVHVFSSAPSYRSKIEAPAVEYIGNLNVRRVRVLNGEKNSRAKRILNVVFYCAGLFFEIIRLRPAVVTASTYPPIFAAFTACLASRVTGAAFIYHVQDIHPELLATATQHLKSRFLRALLTRVDNFSIARANSVITLSNDMATTITRRNARCKKLTIISNFNTENFDLDVNKVVKLSDYKKPLKSVRFIYAGNLGRFQNLDLLLSGLSLVLQKHQGASVLFLGEGTEKSKLITMSSDNSQIFFCSFLSLPDAQSLIADADFGLLSLNPGLYRYCYPSKLYAYLAQGLPVLALIENESSLARTIIDNRLGVVPLDFSEQAILTAANELLSKKWDRQYIKSWLEDNSSELAITESWKHIVKSVVADHCG